MSVVKMLARHNPSVRWLCDYLAKGTATSPPPARHLSSRLTALPLPPSFATSTCHVGQFR